MNRIVLPVLAVFGLSYSAIAAPVSQTDIDSFISQFSSITKDERPRVTDTTDHTYLDYPKAKVSVLLGKDTKSVCITCQDISNTCSKSALYDDLIYQLRPDFHKDQMVNVLSGKNLGGIYYARRPDGLLDVRKEVAVTYIEGKLYSLSAFDISDNSPVPKVNIEPNQAKAIVKSAADHFAFTDTKNETHMWPYYIEQLGTSNEATVNVDINGCLYVSYDYRFSLYVQPIQQCTVVDSKDPDERRYPTLCVSVNATTGDIQKTHVEFISTGGVCYGVNLDHPVAHIPPIEVIENERDVQLGFPCVVDNDTTYIAMPTLQSLAKGHTVAANAGDKTFNLDGTKLALTAKVLDRKGVLYLPWQSLNNLPGVKAQFDAKLAKLSITTATVTKKRRR